MLICINTMDCGKLNLETGYPKPDFAGSGGPSRILKTDLWRFLAGRPSAIGLRAKDHFDGLVVRRQLDYGRPRFETSGLDNWHSWSYMRSVVPGISACVGKFFDCQCWQGFKLCSVLSILYVLFVSHFL